jgi:GDP-L-fucose synthase
MLEGAKVLVAGGAGFLGANLLRRLMELGARVRATLHRRDAVIRDERIEYVRCDLTRMEDCRTAVRGMDFVFMCAASTSGAAVIRSTPLVHVTPNVLMNAQFLEAAYFAKVKKLLWISSNAAYPPTGDRPVKEEEMFTGDPFEAYYGVGWMKRYTETLCRLYSEKLKDPMSTVVLRPSNVYGPHDDFDFATSHVTAALVRRVVERHSPLSVWGSGEDVRDLLYVDDFVDVAILAMESTGGFDAFNVASGRGYRIKDTLRMMLEIDGYADAEVLFDPTKPSTIPIRLMDTSKARLVLGFEARIGLEEGLGRTIRWFRARMQPASG